MVLTDAKKLLILVNFSEKKSWNERISNSINDKNISHLGMRSRISEYQELDLFNSDGFTLGNDNLFLKY